MRHHVCTTCTSARTHARTHAERARTHTLTHTHTHTGSRRTERRGCRCCRKSSPSAAPGNSVALLSRLALLASRTSRKTCRFRVRGLVLAACVLDVQFRNIFGRAQRWHDEGGGQGRCRLCSSLKCNIKFVSEVEVWLPLMVSSVSFRVSRRGSWVNHMSAVHGGIMLVYSTKP